MITFQVDNIEQSIPSEWNELSKQELKFIAARFHLLALEPKDEREKYQQFIFKFRLVAMMLRIKFWQLQLQVKMAKVNKEQMLLLADLANFIFPLKDIELTKNLLPKIRNRGVWIYGPNQLLSNISLEEFAFADKYFLNFMKAASAEDKENALTKLVACLYRNKKFYISNENFKGDNRINFNSYLIDNLTVKYKSISLVEKLCVLMFYWGCRNELVKLYPNVFNSGNKGKASASSLGWVGVIFELGGDKIGTIDQVATKNMHYMLTFLENEIKKSLTKTKT